MQLPAFNINMLIIAILIGMAFYGLLAGKQRLRILILSVYVGIVLAEQLSSQVAPRLSMLSGAQISWLLFGLPVIIFGVVGIAHSRNHDKGAFIGNLIVGILTGALIISSALRLLPTSQMASINNDSMLATNLSQFHFWILGLLPVVALLMGFMKGEKHR